MSYERRNTCHHLQGTNGLRIAVPFTFVTPLDPKHITSVGNQMVAEHVFAFHTRSSFELGNVPVFSTVTIDHAQATLTISPLRSFLNANGKQLTNEIICESIRSAFQNSQHVPYKNLMLWVGCVGKDIVVKLSKVPNNLAALFQLPELAIYDSSKMPLASPEADVSAFTGPYMVQSFCATSVALRPNPHYPQDLVAEVFPSVTFEAYPSEDTGPFVEDLFLSGRYDLAYLFGHSITKKAQQTIEDSDYRYRYSPNEWFVYLGFLPGTPLEDRQIIAGAIDEARSVLLKNAPLGQEAFSIAPSDGPFGLNHEIYAQITSGMSKTTRNLSRPLILGTLEGWAKSPLFEATIQALRLAHPQIELRLFPKAMMNKLYSQEVDMYLSPLGISKDDPLNHLSFLLDGDPIMSTITTREELSQIAAEVSPQKFAHLIMEIEARIAAKRAIVPIGHFPGVVLASKQLVHDESLAGYWGIQAWSYRKLCK